MWLDKGFICAALFCAPCMLPAGNGHAAGQPIRVQPVIVKPVVIQPVVIEAPCVPSAPAVTEAAALLRPAVTHDAPALESARTRSQVIQQRHPDQRPLRLRPVQPRPALSQRPAKADATGTVPRPARPGTR